ncbi:MAG: imidazole glycerol phosphate synthase cyclase subunit [Oscillospiraceae bacterium]|nr:imidazole glycerol phosphate synthase cyclase subunit [Oscillospiraceae bacterium]
MSAKRIIPCMDIRDGRIVKGVKFEGLQDIADPVEMAKYYNSQGASELVFYDITASNDGRAIYMDLLKSVAACVDIPLMAAGAINSLDRIESVLNCGVSNVSINTGAVKDRTLIAEAAKKFGSERVTLAMDCKRESGKFFVYLGMGRENTGLEMTEWARRGEADGAGGIVLNSIDTDGVREGFDLEMLEAVLNAVKIPVVASGGAGCKEDFLELFRKLPAIDAGLAASIFHSKELKIPDLKKYLSENGVAV